MTDTHENDPVANGPVANGPVDRLLAAARAHRAPPGLWPAIAARARRRAASRPWLQAAAVLLGGVGYLLAAEALRPLPRPSPARGDDITSTVAVAWQYLGRGATAPALPEQTLLRLLADEPRRNR